MDINISYLGHGEPNFHNDHHIFLKKILEKANYKVSISKNIVENKLNILFEGFWPDLYDEVRNEILLKKNKTRLLLLTTEFWVGSDHKNISSFSYNNWIYERQIKSKLLKNIYLSSINFIFNLLLKCEKKIFLNRFAYYLNNANHESSNIFNRLILLPLHWKKLCYGTYSLFKYFDGLICFGPDKNINKICELNSKPIFFLKWIEDNLSFEDNENSSIKKKYDFHFTGRMNEYRRNILKKIESFGYKVYSEEITNDETSRSRRILESRYSISLKQDTNQNLISVSRVNYSLQHKIPCIIQIDRYQNPTYFHHYLHFFRSEKIENCLKFYIQNYKDIQKRFDKRLNNLKIDSEKQLQELKVFIREMI